jgi:dTDP-4-dehydrorhamnose 3,5-epimerase
MNLKLVEMKKLVGGTGASFVAKKKIVNSLGDLRHIVKNESGKNLPFSEIYFSEVKPKTVKAWKFHSKHSQNISVAFGAIRIICIKKKFDETVYEVFELNSEELHGILNIPAGIHYSLINVSEFPTILLNATDEPHNPEENFSLPLEYLEFASLILEFGSKGEI